MALRHGVGELSVAPIMVVLADDHVAMRRSLRLLLDGERGIQVVAEAGDAATAARHVRDLRPHVLVVDMGLGASDSAGPALRSGLELATFVRTNTPETQVVLITMQEHRGFVRRALAAGALGFVRKDRAETELPDAVRAASRGEPYTSATLIGV